MRVILLQDVRNLGRKGATVEVAEGYGRNFLIPRGLAKEATEGNLRAAAVEKQHQAEREKRQLAEARALAERLSSLTVTMRVKTGQGGRLFGSITGKDVAQALASQHRIDVDRRRLELKEPIKQLGTYKIPVRLHAEAVAELTLQVTGE